MKVTFDQLSDDARLWIYQNNEVIGDEKIVQINNDIDEFTSGWAAHQQPLASYGRVYHNRFIVLMVDEHINAASGCSIDSSVAFIRMLEEKYDLSLFDRLTFSYEKEGDIHTVSKQQFSALYRKGAIDEETMVFDTLIKKKADLQHWQKPLGSTWVKRFV